MTAGDIESRLADRPFVPFRLHVSDGSVFTVPVPWAVSTEQSSVPVVSMFDREDGLLIARHWRKVALRHVTQISDANEPE